MEQQSAHDRNVAVIIAHGVGEAEPGYAATTLLETLGRCPGFEPDEDVKVRRLVDPGSSVPDRTFPVFLAGGRLADGTRLTFAELYWADLSKIGPSRMDAFLGFFRIIFEAHHLVDGMLAGARGAGPWLLRHLLLFASWLLRGPLIGFVIATLALLWAALYLPPWVLTRISEPALFALVSALVFLISAAVLVFAVRRRDRTWYDATAWTAFVSAMLLAGFGTIYALELPVVSGCPHWPGLEPDCRQNYIDLVYKMLGHLWRIWGATILVCFAIAVGVAVWWHRRDPDNAPPVLTALGVVLLQFVLWTALMGILAMPLIYRVEEVKGVYALHQDDSAHQKKATPGGVSRPPLPEIAAHPSAQKLFDVVPWDPSLSPWVERLTFGYAINGFIICGVLIAGTTTHLRRYLLARRLARDSGRSRSEDGDRSARELDSGELEKMPRMLVGRGILVTLMTLTFFLALFLVLQLDLAKWLPDGDRWKRLVLPLGWVATLALSVLASLRIGNFVHIARDLIDHQYSHKRASALTRLKKENRAEVWPRRARIQARLEKILDEFIRDGRFDHIVFAVHSQGSVIAFDHLRENGPAIKSLCGSPPDVVTFGSPLSHLYQHYFLEYRELENDITSLRDSIGRWVNIYRIDDYIGTLVAPGRPSRVTNMPIGRGGHTDYWREERLGEVLLKAACRPEPATAAAGSPG